MLFTNKHFIAAMIVTPVLAFGGYFLTDYLVSERPHKAVKGQSYPLAAKSNCRYESGRCTFINGDIKFEISALDSKDSYSINFQLSSNFPLQGANIALATTINSLSPQKMVSANNKQTLWKATVKNMEADNTRLLVVVSINDILYYGETETTFTRYQTGFSQANM